MRVEQNRGQGLGFKVPGLGVVNKQALGAWAAKLYVVLGALITALLSMAEEMAEDPVLSEGNSCTLSAMQTSTIQKVMAGSHASCRNITLGNIMN